MNPIKLIPSTKIALFLACIVTALTTPRVIDAQTLQCVESNGTKYVQLPDFQGYDVWNNGPWVLADDFVCTNTGPITDIHLWGSWANDQTPDPNTTFWLAIYDDTPVSPTNNFSHPGNLLWNEQFTPGQYQQNFFGTGAEHFLDPGPPSILGPESNIWYYCFYPTNIFTQQGSAAAPKIYWLMVYAQSQSPLQYGWKTTPDVRNDVSVHAPWPGAPPVGNPGWTKTILPTGAPLDLAFRLTTVISNPPPPVPCVETNGAKYVQLPNFNGFDVWNSSAFPPGINDGPWILADDFVCTNTGPITDIHLWGSWLNNLVATNTITFWIAMFTDVPTGPTQGSHPGNLLWEQCFPPGQYAESFYSTAQENFMDPGPPVNIGTDSQIWYYCFFPTNPPTQQGTLSNPQIYWLAVFAQMPVGATGNYFGWKTTTTISNDVSVHALWNQGICPTNITGTGLSWIPNHDPIIGAPLDLSFKLTTPTNHCIIPVACAVDKTVECGSSWTFDPPNVGPDPCCPAAPPTVTFLNAVTNTFGPCHEVVTGAWKISDCVGSTAFCTQQVSVVDTTAPIITCNTNRTVECGSAFNFDTPTAIDACCGTNVTVSVLSTMTNNPSCPLVVTRTWVATDCCTNTNVCSQTITVEDTNPPSIVCPTNMTVLTCDTNVAVFWSIAATDTCSSVTTTSAPPSGTKFLANTTNTVTALAFDACGNSNSCTFTVTIGRPVLGSLTITNIATNKVVLSWTDGILQNATNLLGPWNDVPSATSPYTNTTVPPPPWDVFYRLRCASP